MKVNLGFLNDESMSPKAKKNFNISKQRLYRGLTQSPNSRTIYGEKVCAILCEIRKVPKPFTLTNLIPSKIETAHRMY